MVPVREANRVLRVELREVRLWGAEVLIDPDSRVRCPGCWKLLTTDELSRPDNAHAVGLRAPTGALVPSPADDDDDPPPDPSFLAMRW